MKLRLLSGILLGLGLLLSGCTKSNEVKEILIHQHHAPHGGTAVVLGNELCHLEIVQDTEAHTLTAYVLDSEMENFVRIEQPTVELQLATQKLVLHGVENSATGEKVGDTAQFQLTSDFFSKTTTFDAVIKLIKVNNHTFTEVRFNFPNGNDRD